MIVNLTARHILFRSPFQSSLDTRHSMDVQDERVMEQLKSMLAEERTQKETQLKEYTKLTSEYGELKQMNEAQSGKQAAMAAECERMKAEMG